VPESLVERRDGAGLRDVSGGLVFLIGAAAYALVEGPVGADFDLTPLLVGVVAVAAGLVSTRRRAVATGLVLAGWGAAVLAVDHGVVAGERSTPAYMMGIAAGLLVTAAVAPRESRGEWLTSGAVAAFFAPLGLFLAYDMKSVGHWPTWAATLIVLAAWELFWGLRSQLPRPRPAT
jgi:peptidoglycan/LPS O-acetylase OafA/YrhL